MTFFCILNQFIVVSSLYYQIIKVILWNTSWDFKWWQHITGNQEFCAVA